MRHVYAKIFAQMSYKIGLLGWTQSIVEPVGRVEFQEVSDSFRELSFWRYDVSLQNVNDFQCFDTSA